MGVQNKKRHLILSKLQKKRKFNVFKMKITKF